jgi:hypothetical protein
METPLIVSDPEILGGTPVFAGRVFPCDCYSRISKMARACQRYWRPSRHFSGSKLSKRYAKPTY